MTRTIARALMVVLIGIIIASLIIAPAALAKTVTVTGTLVLPADVASPGPDAIAVVTLIDTHSSTEAGNVIGQQRIDGIGDGTIAFDVPYESDTIQPKHAYALFASVIDGDAVWQNAKGVPVITGGPVEAVKVQITPAATGSGVISGGMPLPEGTALGPSAVAITALIKLETGTLVSRQVNPTITALPPAFTVTYDPTLIDPAATYIIKGIVVDGASVWQNLEGVVAIVNGATTGQANVALTLTTANLPVTSPFPSAAPTATPAPTAEPTDSAEPSEAPPTASPTAAPTDSPTPAPTASPTPSPTASPSPTPVPSASPVAPTGVLTGTLDYPETYQLSAGAAAVVALVEGKGKATSSPIVSTQIIDPAGQAPIAFRVIYDPALIDPDAVYTIQAGIFDGEQAWVTAQGLPVITNGVQSDVAVTLSHRPDVAKGEVTGSVTGVGIALDADASSVTVIIDVDTGLSIGVDLTRPTSLPAPFAIPFAISDIQEGGTYVVQAELTSGDTTWANAAGVPVITNDNPVSGVQVVVAEVLPATPSPTPTPLPTPAPSPAPEPDPGLDGGSLLLPLIIIGGLILLGGFLLARSKDDEPPAPPAAPASSGGPPSAEAPTEPADVPAADAPTEPADGPPPAAIPTDPPPAVAGA